MRRGYAAVQGIALLDRGNVRGLKIFFRLLKHNGIARSLRCINDQKIELALIKGFLM